MLSAEKMSLDAQADVSDGAENVSVAALELLWNATKVRVRRAMK
jgi:hypothetical protein